MKLHCQKSEYQQCYSSPDKEKFQAIYEEQRLYIVNRRKEENFHSFLQWDSDSMLDDDCDKGSNCSEATGAVKEEKKACENLVEEQSQKDDQNCQSDTSPLSSCSEADENKPDVAEERDLKSNNSSKKSEIKVKGNERPPFLSYGWADEQTLTGRKKTFNVLASKNSIYPGVLKRLAQTSLEKVKHKQKLERRAQSALSAPTHPIKKTDSSEWLSEYQRCYSSQSSRPSTAASQKRSNKVKARRDHRSTVKKPFR